MRRIVEVWCWIGGGLASAFLVCLIYPARYLGYDQNWALLWGRQLAHGELPGYRSAYAPTPHPLLNAVGALASLAGLGAGAPILFGVTAIAFAGTVLLLARLGAVLYAWPVGLVAGVIIATRPVLVLDLGNASTDVWFLSLLVAALLCQALDPQRPLRVLACLALAGLVRPEAWLLSIGYLLCVVGRRSPRERLLLLGVTVAAPALWLASDALITADPLYSLHGTRALAVHLDRPRSELAALTLLPQYLRQLLGDLPVGLGLLGAVVAAVGFYDRSVPALGVGASGMLTFLTLGILGLPLLDRYLLGPAVVLSLFAGLVLGGWSAAPAGWRRRAWALGSLALITITLTVDTPANVRALKGTVAFTRAREDIQSGLSTLMQSELISRATRNCGIHAPDQASLAVIVDEPRVAEMSAHSGPLAAGAQGVQLAYASTYARDVFAIGASSPLASSDPAPGRVRLAMTRYWVIDARCPRLGR